MVSSPAFVIYGFMLTVEVANQVVIEPPNLSIKNPTC